MADDRINTPEHQRHFEYDDCNIFCNGEHFLTLNDEFEIYGATVDSKGIEHDPPWYIDWETKLTTMLNEHDAFQADRGRLEAMIEYCWCVKKYKEFWMVYDEDGEMGQGDTANAAIDAAMREQAVIDEAMKEDES